jgi:hypothetical protein
MNKKIHFIDKHEDTFYQTIFIVLKKNLSILFFIEEIRNPHKYTISEFPYQQTRPAERRSDKLFLYFSFANLVYDKPFSVTIS